MSFGDLLLFPQVSCFTHLPYIESVIKEITSAHLGIKIIRERLLLYLKTT